MSRLRNVLGLVAAVLMLASSAAHSLLGWPQLRAALGTAHAPPDLVQGLAIGWHFGGATMVTLGVMLAWLFIDRLRGRATSRRPAAFVAALYLVFGAWALAVSDMDPFFLVFVVPGLLLLAAVTGREAR